MPELFALGERLSPAVAEAVGAGAGAMLRRPTLYTASGL